MLYKLITLTCYFLLGYLILIEKEQSGLKDLPDLDAPLKVPAHNYIGQLSLLKHAISPAGYGCYVFSYIRMPAVQFTLPWPHISIVYISKVGMRLCKQKLTYDLLARRQHRPVTQTVPHLPRTSGVNWKAFTRGAHMVFNEPSYMQPPLHRHTYATSCCAVETPCVRDTYSI